MGIKNFAWAFVLVSAALVDAAALKRGRCDSHVQAGQSIQAAIDAAHGCSSICIAPGTYAEQLTITKDGISLIGYGAALVPPATFITNLCSGLVANQSAGICIAGSGVVFGDCPYPEHCKVSSVGTPVKDITIEGFQVSGFGENIAVVGAENTAISCNTVVDGGYYGIVAVGSKNTRTTNNIIQTTMDMCFIAICTDNFAGVQTSNNQITGYDIGLCIQTSGSVQENNHITGCCVGAFTDPNVTGAFVRNNYIGPTDPRCAANFPYAGGILVTGAIGTTIESNTIDGQMSNGQSAGIALVDGPPGSSNNIISHNTLTNNDIDIYVNTTGTGNQIEGNQCVLSFPAGFC